MSNPEIDVLTPDELANELKLEGSRKARRRKLKELGIPAIRLSSRTIRYRRSDVEEWLRRHVVGGNAA